MPRITYCGKPKPDALKALIIMYKNMSKKSDDELAKEMNISRTTLSKRINHQHTDVWLSEAKKLCKILNVPIEEFRNTQRY